MGLQVTQDQLVQLDGALVFAGGDLELEDSLHDDLLDLAVELGDVVELDLELLDLGFHLVYFILDQLLFILQSQLKLLLRLLCQQVHYLLPLFDRFSVLNFSHQVVHDGQVVFILAVVVFVL